MQLLGNRVTEYAESLADIRNDNRIWHCSEMTLLDMPTRVVEANNHL